MDSTTKNMTSGHPASLIFKFALPLMGGSIFQELYVVSDAAIVGRGLGMNALAAAGAIDWYYWMLLACLQGLCMGFSILIAQAFGASDHVRLKKVTGNALVLTAFFALFVLILTQLITPAVLHGLQTPDEIYPMAIRYARIIFAGMPVIAAYNIFASILRSLGNSKTPFNAMLIASFLNIALDMILILGLHLGIESAAIATVFSQFVSCIYCYLVIRRIEVIRLSAEDYHLDPRLTGKMLYLGLPMGLEMILIGFGGLFVQRTINSFGLIYIAAFVACNKLFGLIEMAAIAFGYAVATYVGQNLGAMKIHRIKQGIRAAVVINILTALLLSALVFLIGRPLLTLFIAEKGANAAASLDMAVFFLRVMAIFLPGLYLVHLFKNALEGLGNSILPMLAGVGELIARFLVVILLLTLKLSPKWIILAEICAWFASDIVQIPGYFYLMHKIQKNQNRKTCKSS